MMRRMLYLLLAGMLGGMWAAPLRAQTDGTLQWSFATQGAVLSSAAIAPDGTIYVGSEGRRLWAINPNGSFKWRFPNVPDLLLTTDWFDAAPTIGPDGTIYIGDFNGRLYAINPDGTTKWPLPHNTGSYIVSSVAIGADGTLYFGAGDGALHALNPATGAELWAFYTQDWVDSSPAVGADGTIYVGSWDGRVYAVNPNGTLKWSLLTGEAVQSSPAIGPDGTIYIGSGDASLYAITPAGVVAWTFPTADSVDGSPVVGPDGTIYFGSADGYFYALKPDGTEAWAAPFHVGQGIFGAPALRADGAIIFGASDRKIYALNADGSLKWTYAVGDVVDASPAIAPNGTIYIGSYDQRLHAFNGSGAALADSSWPKFRRDALNQAQVPASAMVLAPDITNGPLSQTVEFGALVTFSVTVTGTQPLAFRWQKDAVDIPGATSSSFVIDQAAGSDAGSYRVIVANEAGSDTSPDAVLTVNLPDPPAIVNDPRPLTVVTGNRMSLWVNATGSAPLAYQWSKEGTPIVGATNQFYEVDTISAIDAGSYTVAITNPGGSITSAAANVAVSATANAQLVNLSARALVGTEASILIPGFVIGGTASRQILIRAAGPTLVNPPFNVGGVLEDPTLTIYAGATPILTNDNWEDASNAATIASVGDALGAFPLEPMGADAAALVDLAPGLYTVQVSGVAGTTGVSLVELYDNGAVTAGTSRLANLSARAEALTGGDILIAGFSIAGSTAKTVLIRAVGPTLSSPPYNLPDVLADPVLTVYEQTTPIIAQSDWTESPDVPAIELRSAEVGAFPLEGGSADAALLLVLMPGSYTAQAAGFGGTTGNVLIEVYEVQ